MYIHPGMISKYLDRSVEVAASQISADTKDAYYCL